MFLQMLKAEEEGLVEVKVELESEDQLLQTLFEYFASENVSDIANAWNAERREIIKQVMLRFEKSMQKYVKETVRNECEDRVALSCRRGYFEVRHLYIETISLAKYGRNSTRHRSILLLSIMAILRVCLQYPLVMANAQKTLFLPFLWTKGSN